MATELSVPDPSITDLHIQKSTYENQYASPDAVAVKTALTAPQKPVVVGTVDKTQVRVFLSLLVVTDFFFRLFVATSLNKLLVPF